jgi:hypothetical protein
MNHSIEFWLWAEMEEEAKLEISRPQIVGDLPYRALVKGAGRFGLDDQLAIDNHIQALTRYLLPFIQDGHTNLASDIMATIV